VIIDNFFVINLSACWNGLGFGVPSRGCDMRLPLTGHKGYIGAVAGPILRSAGDEVVGLGSDLFTSCEFGQQAEEIPEIRKDIRDLTRADLEGFDAAVHLAALSSEP
jgi:nucleoside-diphosphate-sugar epimerase